MRLPIIPMMICCALLWSGTAIPAQTGEATPTVKAVLDRAIEIQTRADLAGDARRKDRTRLVRQLILDNFDFSEMARDAIKGSWDQAAPNQRSEFQRLFTELFQDSYTRMVLNFLRQETIDYRGESAEKSGTLVKTAILRANEHIPVDYRLARKGNRWLIRDVDIDGVSIMEHYRSSFRQVIQTNSFDGLLKKMRLQSQVLQDKAAD
jgi:phospholipid transport system substrate-binding protein